MGADHDARKDITFRADHGNAEHDIKHADNNGDAFIKRVLDKKFNARGRRVQACELGEAHGRKQTEQSRNQDGYPGEFAFDNDGHLQAGNVARCGKSHSDGCRYDCPEF